MGPDPPDAWTFITFATMMLVIAVVIVGIGGILHGFPSFSGLADTESSGEHPSETIDGNETGSEVDQGGGSSNDGAEGSDPLFDDDTDDGSSEGDADRTIAVGQSDGVNENGNTNEEGAEDAETGTNESDETNGERVPIETETRDGAGFENE